MDILLSIFLEFVLFGLFYLTGAICIKTFSLGKLSLESKAEYKARIAGGTISWFQMSWPSIYKREGSWTFDMQAVQLTGITLWLIFGVILLISMS